MRVALGGARGLGIALSLAVLSGACAKKAPPSGGPPDVEPPRLIASEPDSGAAGVALDARISLTFSEGMEPRSTGEAIALAPRVGIRQLRWSGRTVTVVLEKPLEDGRTYTVFVGNGARDRHGNPLASGATLVFSTADTLPPGQLAGTLAARGFGAAGTYLWCYRAGREPDSTARDFDALGLVGSDNRFRVVGLSVPETYRLWAFADLNRNRSFEPDVDVLAPIDTTFTLAEGRAAALGLELRVVNSRATASLRGTVLDSLAITQGTVIVVAVSERDSTRRVADEADERGQFELQLAAGTWRLFAYRDLDRNRTWQRDREPASAVTTVTVGPADEIRDLQLLLERPRGSP